MMDIFEGAKGSLWPIEGRGTTDLHPRARGIPFFVERPLLYRRFRDGLEENANGLHNLVQGGWRYPQSRFLEKSGPLRLLSPVLGEFIAKRRRFNTD